MRDIRLDHSEGKPQPRHKSRPRRTHIFECAEREHYVDPVWCSARLFDVEDFGGPGARILDPACGWGRILRTGTDAGYKMHGADIVDTRRLDARDTPFTVRDFLKTPPPDRFTGVSSNPPFDAIEAFCRRALEIAEYKVAMISPLPRLPAARWLNSLPLKKVYLLQPRPSMPPAEYLESGQKPGGGRPEFCWLVFEKGWVGSPELKWLCRDGERHG
jgi:hypothetical protein